MADRFSFRRSWLQISLRGLLLLTLLVGIFFGGRSTRQPEIDRLGQEIESLRDEAQVLQHEFDQRAVQVPWIRGAPGRSGSPTWQQIEQGMKADALERMQGPTQLLEPLAPR